MPRPFPHQSASSTSFPLRLGIARGDLENTIETAIFN